MDKAPRLTAQQRLALEYAKANGKVGWWAPVATLRSLEKRGLIDAWLKLTPSGDAVLAEANAQRERSTI